jgi:ABC-type lipoprotein release transport system permease subunit
MAVGLPCAGLAAAALERLLFDVPAFDRLTFAAALAILLGLAAVASWVPARRAGAIDPIRALRVD